MRLSSCFNAHPGLMPARLMSPIAFAADAPKWSAAEQSAPGIFKQSRDPLNEALKSVRDINPALNNLTDSQIKIQAIAVIEKYAQEMDIGLLSCYEYLILEMFVKTGMLDSNQLALLEKEMNSQISQVDLVRTITGKVESAWLAFSKILSKRAFESAANNEVSIDPTEFRSKLTEFVKSLSAMENDVLAPIISSLNKALPVFLAKFSVRELPQLCDDFRSVCPDELKFDSVHPEFSSSQDVAAGGLSKDLLEQEFLRFSHHSNRGLIREFAMDYFHLNMGLSIISLTKSLVKNLIISPKIDIKDAALVLNAVIIVARDERNTGEIPSLIGARIEAYLDSCTDMMKSMLKEEKNEQSSAAACR